MERVHTNLENLKNEIEYTQKLDEVERLMDEGKVELAADELKNIRGRGTRNMGLRLKLADRFLAKHDYERAYCTHPVPGVFFTEYIDTLQKENNPEEMLRTLEFLEQKGHRRLYIKNTLGKS